MPIEGRRRPPATRVLGDPHLPAARRSLFAARGLVFCVLALGLRAAGAAEPPVPVPPQETPAREPPDYHIGPGDALSIFVWKEPELTRDVTVRLDGKISVPLLGDVVASGRTPQQLGDDIAARLKRFVEAPQVTVGLTKSSSRFYVVGQVARPGDFPLLSPTTLVQALALAGGLREFAKAESIIIVRREGDAQTFLAVNYKKLETARDASQNVAVRPGDTIVVP
jgi:polysaccharide biosynthesis/export protein